MEEEYFMVCCYIWGMILGREGRSLILYPLPYPSLLIKSNTSHPPLKFCV